MPAGKKIRDWFVRLHALKLAKVKADSELYGAFDAAALFLGTAAFHHPRFVLEHMHEDHVPQLRNVLELLLAGMDDRPRRQRHSRATKSAGSASTMRRR